MRARTLCELTDAIVVGNHEGQYVKPASLSAAVMTS